MNRQNEINLSNEFFLIYYFARPSLFALEKYIDNGDCTIKKRTPNKLPQNVWTP